MRRDSMARPQPSPVGRRSRHAACELARQRALPQDPVVAAWRAADAPTRRCESSASDGRRLARTGRAHARVLLDDDGSRAAADAAASRRASRRRPECGRCSPARRARTATELGRPRAGPIADRGAAGRSCVRRPTTTPLDLRHVAAGSPGAGAGQRPSLELGRSSTATPRSARAPTPRRVRPRTARRRRRLRRSRASPRSRAARAAPWRRRSHRARRRPHAAILSPALARAERRAARRREARRRTAGRSPRSAGLIATRAALQRLRARLNDDEPPEGGS